MEQVYRFVPKCRELGSYLEAYKGLICLVSDFDTETVIVEFPDGVEFTLPKDEIVEVKFRGRNMWVY